MFLLNQAVLVAYPGGFLPGQTAKLHGEVDLHLIVAASTNLPGALPLAQDTAPSDTHPLPVRFQGTQVPGQGGRAEPRSSVALHSPSRFSHPSRSPTNPGH